jgi:hypothetical protein
MILHIIFGQRICRYVGQYAPEALEIIDEYGNEDNPAFLVKTLKEYKESGEFTAVELINVSVDGDKIDKILNSTPSIIGKIAK